MLPQKVPRDRIGRCPMPRHPRQKRSERTTGNGRFETSVPGQRANAQVTPVLAHIIECLDAIDVDQAGGTGEAKIHRRHETLSASKDLSFLTVRGEEIERVVNAAGRKISERDGFHRRKRKSNRVPFVAYFRSLENSGSGLW